MAKWAQKAGTGDFAVKAKAAGMTPQDYARKHEHTPGKLGQQARSALAAVKPSPKPKTDDERRESRYGR